MSNLKQLLKDLGQDAELQRAFEKDPEAVMARYELSEEARQALRENDADRLRELSGTRNLSLTNSTVSSYD